MVNDFKEASKIDLKEAGKLLWEEWNIDIDEITFEQLDYYIAVENHLTDEDEPPPDTENLEKVRRYLEAFHHLGEVEDWQRAHQTLTKTFILSKIENWGYYKEIIYLCCKILYHSPWLDIFYLLSLGNAYNSLGESRQAINYFEQNLDILPSLTFDDELVQEMKQMMVVQSLSGLGTSYNFLGEYKKSINFLEKAEKIACSINNKELQKELQKTVIHGLGITYQSLGEYSKAIDYVRQSLNIARETMDKPNEAAALSNIGMSCFSLKDSSRAIDYFQQSLNIAREIESKQGEALVLGNIGATYCELGDYASAIEYNEKCLVITREIGDRRQEGITLLNIGYAYASSKKYSLAIKNFEQSLEIAREVENIPGVGQALGHLQQTYTSQTINLITLGLYKRVGLVLDSLPHPKVIKYILKNAISMLCIWLLSFTSLLKTLLGVLLSDDFGLVFAIMAFSYYCYLIKMLLPGKEWWQALWFSVGIGLVFVAQLFSSISAAWLSMILLSINVVIFNMMYKQIAIYIKTEYIFQQLGVTVDAMPYANWVKSLLKFARRGWWQRGLCFIVGVSIVGLLFAPIVGSALWACFAVSIGLLWGLIRARMKRQ